MQKFLRKLFFGLVLVLGVGVFIFLIAGMIPERNPLIPAGCKQNQSVYVAMKDGTRLAVRIALPYDLQENEKVPAIMEITRYGTKNKKSFLLNSLFNLGLVSEKLSPFFETLLRSKYTLVRVDARGSGASFGQREMEWSKAEVEDTGQLIEWIINQSWSNGKVGAYGISYSGNTAELATVANHPALLATAPLYSDFDPMAQLAIPGGIFNEVLMKKWSASNIAMDANQKNLLVGGIAPVDQDTDEILLKEALASHQTIDLFTALHKITFFDDILTEGYKVSSLAPYNYQDKIERSNVPFYVRVGWHDAGTVNGAIERFLTYQNSQTLVIGPWSHGGWHFYDPFIKNSLTSKERVEEEKMLMKDQAEQIIKFFDIHLKGKTGNAQGKQIKYYTLGEGKWKTTDVWPVVGFERKIFYFASNGGLIESKPDSNSDKDTYRVDFTASTGKSNRWHTNIGGGSIYYPNRAEEDKKLLTYTTKPLEYDVEITGVPTVTLNLSSTSTDGAFFVYLEDVGPDGMVTYLSEGQLRALHRKVNTEDFGSTVLGPKHSFLKKDGQLLTPGENTELKISMFAISVLLKKGHRLRIAIAGHDEANFQRIPTNEEPILEIQRNKALASYVELPMKRRYN